MLKATFLVPLLALSAFLTFSAPANAGGNAMAFDRGGYNRGNSGMQIAGPPKGSPIASSFGPNDTVISRGIFKKTETRIAVNGDRRMTTQSRRLFGGFNTRVVDRTADSKPAYDMTEKTTRRGNVKESVTAGPGWMEKQKTRLNIFTGNRTTKYASQNPDGSGRERVRATAKSIS